MRTLSDLIGLPVVNLRNGEMVGEIDQLHWNAATGEITAIAARGSHGLIWFPLEEVERVGQDAIFLKSGHQAEGQLEHGSWSIDGLTVYDQDGNELGSVSDLMVDLAHGKVMGLNVSGGLLRDIVEGRQFVPWASAQLGKDAIIVGGVQDYREDGK